jgi:hypothetical protein
VPASRLQTTNKFSKAFSVWLAAILLAGFCCYSLGCKRHARLRLSSAQVHQITQELAKAAIESAPAGSVVKTHVAPVPSASLLDTISITLHGTSETQNRVLQKLESVAADHKLNVESSVSEHGAHVTLRQGDNMTHRIDVDLLPGRIAEKTAAPTTTRSATCNFVG